MLVGRPVGIKRGPIGVKGESGAIRETWVPVQGGVLSRLSIQTEVARGLSGIKAQCTLLIWIEIGCKE